MAPVAGTGQCRLGLTDRAPPPYEFSLLLCSPPRRDHGTQAAVRHGGNPRQLNAPRRPSLAAAKVVAAFVVLARQCNCIGLHGSYTDIYGIKKEVIYLIIAYDIAYDMSKYLHFHIRHYMNCIIC